MSRSVAVNGSSRLRRGVAILAQLKAQDTTRIDERLAVFEKTHVALEKAQVVFSTAEAKLKEARAEGKKCDAEQDHAVEMLARALVADGHARSKPFVAFGGLPPGKLKGLPPTEEARAIHALVGEMKKGKNLSATTLAAAAAADLVAAKVEALPKNISKLEAAASEARRIRDGWNQEWDTSEAALRRLARLVEQEGGPPLYSRGFGQRPRATSKSQKAKEALSGASGAGGGGTVAVKSLPTDHGTN